MRLRVQKKATATNDISIVAAIKAHLLL